MEEDKRAAKEAKKREKDERRRREKEERARLKAERRELREERKREKLEALGELQELPEVGEGGGEALYCGSRVDACVVAEEGPPSPHATPRGRQEKAARQKMGSAPVAEEPGEQAAAPGAVEAHPPEALPAPGEASPEEEEEEGWLSRLRQGLSKSRVNFVAPLTRAMASRRFDVAFWEEVEDILVGADVGVEMTGILVRRVKERMAGDKAKEPSELLALFQEVLAEALDIGDRELRYASGGPSVFMVVGVNGTGKTTTIAKLAYLLRRDGKRVLLAAGDTFRAAGVEQLEAWGNRVGVHTVKHRQGADAAAVVHDAVESARARDVEVVIADTAGRLHTKTNLMEELKKIKRVAEKNAEVTETLLVIDATTGQNGLIQARQFREAVEVTGVVLTKLDGTAKGGIVVAIVHELGIPIKFIGVGEKLDDLHAFDPREFAQALFSGGGSRAPA